MPRDTIASASFSRNIRNAAHIAKAILFLACNSQMRARRSSKRWPLFTERKRERDFRWFQHLASSIVWFSLVNVCISKSSFLKICEYLQNFAVGSFGSAKFVSVWQAFIRCNRLKFVIQRWSSMWSLDYWALFGMVSTNFQGHLPLERSEKLWTKKIVQVSLQAPTWTNLRQIQLERATGFSTHWVSTRWVKSAKEGKQKESSKIVISFSVASKVS